MIIVGMIASSTLTIIIVKVCKDKQNDIPLKNENKIRAQDNSVNASNNINHAGDRIQININANDDHSLAMPKHHE